MRVGHETIIRIGSHHINIIEIIAGIRLAYGLRMPPHPLGVGQIIEAHIGFGICHQGISLGSLKCSIGSPAPLPGEQTGTRQQPIDNTHIGLELRVVIRTDIALKKLFSLIQVFENLRVQLLQSGLALGLCCGNSGFGIERNSRSSGIF